MKNNYTSKKIDIKFYKRIAYIILFLISTNIAAQGTSCATSETLTINGSCDVASITDTTQDTPLASGCSFNTFRREGWYTFTVPAGPSLNITITASASDRNLFLQLISSSSTCTGLTQIACANTTTTNGAQTETISTSLSPGIYYIKAINNGNNNDMNLTSICVTSSTNPCSTATTLPCGTSSLTGTTVSSTSYTHTSGCSMSDYGAWYTFVGDGQQTTISSTAAFDHEMSISSGSCGTLTNITCQDVGLSGGTETYTFTTNIGTTYYIYIAHYLSGSTTTGTFTISRTCTTAPTPPANDNCTGSIALTVNPSLTCTTTTSGTIAAATNSGVSSSCFGTSDDDVWYRFVATSTTHYVSLLNIAGSTTDLYHAVYSGASGCGSLGSSLICSDPESSIVTGLTIGQTYYVQVYSYTSTSGQTSTFDICIGTPPPPPSNDNCSGAIVLTVNPNNLCGTVTAGTIASATNSGVSSSCFGTSDDDVWYRFVATSTSHYVSLLNIAGSTTDLYHAVYSGVSGCGSLGSALICSDPESSTITGLTIGQTYYVQVYSYTSTSGQTSTFDICIGTPPPPPSNDNCSGAIALTVNPTVVCTTTTTGSVASATNSGVSSSCFGTSDDDVWYSFVATSTSHNISLLNISGSTTDLYHAVYSGVSGCGSLGAALICSDPNTSTVTGLTIGQTYYVQVYSYTSTAGQTSVFNICIGTNVPCTPGSGNGTSSLGCPSVVTGGLGLNGADPATFNCTTATCVDLEATYLQLGQTTTYRVESIPYAPPYQFNCLTNPVSVNDDDVWSPIVNLPFNFCFYGNSYNSCTIGSNAMLSFNTANANGASGYSFSNNLPSTTGALFANTIYGVYHDIDPSVGGEVGWELITLNSGCRALVASWSNVPMFSNNSLLYTGMMVLYENTNIIEVYIKEKRIDGTWNGGNAIVGVQNSAGTAAVVAPGRNGLDTDWTATNEAWRFVPDGTSITSIVWHEGSGVLGPIVGTTAVINVCPSATTTYTAEVTYTLCNGTTLKETDETTVTVNNGKVWNGSLGTNWATANNWTPNGIPNNSDCVIIPITANNPIISGGSYNGLAGTLTVNNGATLTVNSGNSLSVTNAITVVTGGNIIIQDDANLIQVTNTGITNTGNITFQRTTTIRELDYVYWSSPVKLTNTPTYFPVSQISPGTPLDVIWKWNPTHNGNDYGIWENANEGMLTGKGYIVRGPNGYPATVPTDYTATFVGIPNNGLTTATVSRGTRTSSYASPGGTATADDDNWNLIGNPYPSSIDALAFLSSSVNPNLDGSVRLWTHGLLPSAAYPDPFYQDFVYNYSVNDYVNYNSLGSTPPGFLGKIGAGQSFFVLLNHSASTPGTVTFNNNMRHNSSFVPYSNNQFYRSNSVSHSTSTETEPEIEKHRIWINITDSSGIASNTLIGYTTGATLEKDRNFDAIHKVTNQLGLYSLIDDKQYIIQGRPVPFNQNDIVPLGVSIPANGTYNIAINMIDGLFNNSGQNVYLEDTLLGIIHNIKEQPYTFTTVAGINENRFFLRYTNPSLNNNDLNSDNTIKVVTNEFISLNSTIEMIDNILVYDALGRLLANYKNVDSNSFTIKDLQKNNAPLLLKIKLENGIEKIQKIIY